MVLHRIQRNTDEGFVTKGDANDKEDLALVPKNKAAGKVMFCVPYLGYFLMGLSSKTVRAGALAAVLLAMLCQIKRKERNRLK